MIRLANEGLGGDPFKRICACVLHGALLIAHFEGYVNPFFEKSLAALATLALLAATILLVVSLFHWLFPFTTKTWTIATIRIVYLSSLDKTLPDLLKLVIWHRIPAGDYIVQAGYSFHGS